MSAIWAAALTGRNYGPDLSFPMLQVPVSSGRGRWRRPWPALFHSNHALSELRGLVRRTGSLARERRRNRAALPALAAEPSLPTGGADSARLLTVAQSSRLRRFTQALLDPREVSLPRLRLPSRRSMESSGPMPPLSVRSGADADALSDLGLMAPARLADGERRPPGRSSEVANMPEVSWSGTTANLLRERPSHRLDNQFPFDARWLPP